jgi:photoactive yellow protein
MDLTFTNPGLMNQLDSADSAAKDALPFGVVTMLLDGTVTGYNLAESRLSGLTRESVMGRNFFSSVAPCTNNFMVAQRFATEPALDVILPYVFSTFMKPVAVRLRLLKQPGRHRMFLAVEVS